MDDYGFDEFDADGAVETPTASTFTASLPRGQAAVKVKKPAIGASKSAQSKTSSAQQSSAKRAGAKPAAPATRGTSTPAKSATSELRSPGYDATESSTLMGELGEAPSPVRAATVLGLAPSGPGASSAAQALELLGGLQSLLPKGDSTAAHTVNELHQLLRDAAGREKEWLKRAAGWMERERSLKDAAAALREHSTGLLVARDRALKATLRKGEALKLDIEALRTELQSAYAGDLLLTAENSRREKEILLGRATEENRGLNITLRLLERKLKEAEVSASKGGMSAKVDALVSELRAERDRTKKARDDLSRAHDTMKRLHEAVIAHMDTNREMKTKLEAMGRVAAAAGSGNTGNVSGAGYDPRRDGGGSVKSGRTAKTAKTSATARSTAPARSVAGTRAGSVAPARGSAGNAARSVAASRKAAPPAKAAPSTTRAGPAAAVKATPTSRASTPAAVTAPSADSAELARIAASRSSSGGRRMSVTVDAFAVLRDELVALRADLSAAEVSRKEAQAEARSMEMSVGTLQKRLRASGLSTSLHTPEPTMPVVVTLPSASSVSAWVEEEEGRGTARRQLSTSPAHVRIGSPANALSPTGTRPSASAAVASPLASPPADRRLASPVPAVSFAPPASPAPAAPSYAASPARAPPSPRFAAEPVAEPSPPADEYEADFEVAGGESTPAAPFLVSDAGPLDLPTEVLAAPVPSSSAVKVRPKGFDPLLDDDSEDDGTPGMYQPSTAEPPRRYRLPSQS